MSNARRETTQKKFTVYQYFPDGSYGLICRDVGLEAALNTAKSYTTRPGAGTRIIIVDESDMTVFEWKNGEGVIFPKPESAAP